MKKIIKEVVENILTEYWKPYDEIEINIEKLLNKRGIKTVESVFCTGELTNIYVYVQIGTILYIYNENCDYENAYLLKNNGYANVEFYDKIAIIDNFDLNLCNIVKVSLINMCVIENFPIPRLNLSTGAIAAYIRRYQKARVKIIDMQLRIKIDEIIDILEEDKPNIIGISISFGQKYLSDDLINRILLNDKLIYSKVVVGNVIPSLYNKRIIVSYKEGEESFLDLIDYISEKKYINEVRGIAYIDDNGDYKINKIGLLNIENLPFPALDTIEGVLKYKGALTLELSRGCNYSKCTFCPRAHKGAKWRNISVESMILYFKTLEDVCKKLNIPPFFYIADEEFIGQLPHDYELKRIELFGNKIKELGINVKFDISARVDSIFKECASKKENIERLKMWKLLKDIGLQRVFLGVESGSDNQLKRFNKGTTSYQNAVAIQLITALGINIRIGYISFDPLMENFKDIIESHKFIERKDILYKEVDLENISLDQIYDNIIEQNMSSNIQLQDKPLYFKVSYPLTSLEILFSTAYESKVRECEKNNGIKLITEIDMNMARYKSLYYNKKIGCVSDFCQRWIDYNFPVLYSLKGLYKTSFGETKEKIYNLMTLSKSIDHYLLNYILFQLEEITDDEELVKFIKPYDFKLIKINGTLDEILIESLNSWQNIELDFINKITDWINDETIKDTEDSALTNAIKNWHKHRGIWNKIN